MYKTFTNTRVLTTIVAAVTASFLASAANAQSTSETVKVLTANFDSRQVVQVEVGDFHFLPGQVAPIHTHSAPAIGFVVKGSIIYQIEGEKPQVLKEGNAFYEPVGPRILRFDNASATQEAIFVDFNLEQEGEPFIVFETPPTEAIDRRTLPTFDLADTAIDQVDVTETRLAPAGTAVFANDFATVGVVAQGVIEIRNQAGELRRVIAGQSFALDEGAAKITNASTEVPAKIISFLLIPTDTPAQ